MLKNAAESLLVAYAWDPASKVTPLIRPPGPDLLKALTTLEKGEQWLLQPRQMGSNPHLWSPGIKLGVKPNSFTYRTELFGPLLGVMKAKNLPHALALANGTPYGLTAGLHSLDEREHHYWINHIEAGNCYINRGITGAIVQRQPFGGFKSSHFGPGAKTGGPNYLMNLMHPMQKDLPLEQEMLPSNLEPIGFLVKKIYGKDQVAYWEHSVRNYAFYWRHYFSKKHDPSQILGQANFLSYRPHPQQCVRIQNREELFDAMLCLSAAAICEASLTVSLEKDVEIEGIPQLSQIKLMRETESQLIQRLAAGKIKRMRYFSSPTSAIYQAAAAADCYLLVARPLSNGRVELLRYLREISLSIDYHRYGYISQA
jgi:RHH-type proline utilization regulon transcriptional repressor/proline dehydrogenase/delta 1-pyrroline-5-carboxylate dehydrogenase